MSVREPTDEWLDRGFRTRPGSSAGPACPDAETLVAAQQGELAAPQRRDIVAHLASCAACAEDWRLSATLGDELAAAPLQRRASERSDGPESSSTTRSRRRWPLWGGAAAMALAATVALVVLPSERDETTPVYRDAGPTAPAIAAEQIDAQFGFAAATGAFSWPTAPERARYRLLLNDADLRSIETIENLDEARFVATGALLSRLRARSFYWQVQTVAATGETRLSPVIHGGPRATAPIDIHTPSHQGGDHL